MCLTASFLATGGFNLFQNACMVYKHAYLNTLLLLQSTIQCGEDTTKRGGWGPCIKIVMEITFLIVENHGIVFLNFCGNPVLCMGAVKALVRLHII